MDVSPKALREARDLFESMLRRKTKEAEWQAFFAAHPYALTPSLPLRLEARDIIPLGRPGKTEPDLIFYAQDSFSIPIYGVIELKRPDQRIASITRANVGQLSRDAQTAVIQSKQYIETVPDLANKQLNGRNLFLGNNQYLFVIMGLSDELIFQPGQEMFWQMIRRDLPGNLQFLPYDIVFRNFDHSIYRQIHILVPRRPAVEGFMRLRAEPTTLSDNQVKMMLQEKGFYDRLLHFLGTGVKHQYQRERNGRIVNDATTGLTWQQSGSPREMNFENAQKYIDGLNHEGFGGYSDWRLPTLEEAMSLMEPEQKNRNLYIDPVFDREQSWIWTADKDAAGSLWEVSFDYGDCYDSNIYYDIYVRAVRS